uniref:tRNA wybutosine-synthesizing protein 2 n=1 Tax=Aceria tosichella TaxID=561515 RepID=A0A6G1SNT2_9ACAR
MFHRMMNYGELELRPGAVITKDLIRKHMPKYKRHDDLIIVHEVAWEEFKKSIPMPVVEDENSPFSIDEHELASLVCQTIQKPTCRRLALDTGVKSDGFRSPNIRLLLGENGIVNHKDNHILYRFDVTKCMFSFGNVREKMRMAELDCSNEIVVDLFAGIGYFTLPLLIHARAKHLYACEWNPDAIAALKENLKINRVDASRYTVIEGDNRKYRPENVAQRVMLGILPSCQEWMKTALECVDSRTGAILHCHDLVESKPASPSKNCTTTTTTTDKQNSTGSSDFIESNDNNHNQQQQSALLADNQSMLNQSISSSSTSSHSTIEKLSVPSDDLAKLLQSSESDKDTSSPVLLDKPSPSANVNSSNSSFLDSTTTNNSNSTNDHASLTSSTHDDSIIIEPPQIAESLTGCYEARGLALIECIRGQLEARNLSARLLHIQPVKSYAPHINHVVFDIKLEPRWHTNNQTIPGSPSTTNNQH